MKYLELSHSDIVIRENGIVKPYLTFTDNLGSILSVMDEDGTKVFDASYDAWGKQTVTLNTIGLHRGYTGHEMLGEFDIINMNGRLYDPILGRFFSPDNYVQMPDNSQNFNRYSYCLNNPLKYTDPSGNLFGIDDAMIAFAAFNMASSMMQAAFEGTNVWKAGALSLFSSAASYGIGAAFGNTGKLGHELLRAGAHGLASGVISALDGGNFASTFVSSAAASGIGSFAQSVNMDPILMIASTTSMGGVVAWATGGDFLQGAMQGMNIGLFNHALHDGDSNGMMGGSATCEVLPDGTYVAPESLDEVYVTANRLYKLPFRILTEKPLKPVYPEFVFLFLRRAVASSIFSAIRSAYNEYSNRKCLLEELKPTIDRIEKNQILSKFKRDGSIHRNNEGRLPYFKGQYREWVVPTKGIKGPGPRRIVSGNGHLWYSPDHYHTFIKVK